MIDLDHTSLYIFERPESLNHCLHSLFNNWLQSPDADHGEEAVQCGPPSFVLVMSNSREHAFRDSKLLRIPLPLVTLLATSARGV